MTDVTGFDRFSRWASRAVLGLFFRQVETSGLELVPASGPLLVVANHPNGLIDPVVLLGVLPRPVRFLGKSTLWAIPALRPFLALGGVIPVYRRHDPGVDPAKNAETFARCRQALGRGEAVALFPEGVSHTEPRLLPLKTGAARIALETAAELAPTGPVLRILPVGLAFEERDRFRSRAVVTVGAPLTVTANAEPAAARELTARIDAALSALTASFDSWHEAERFQRAAELFGRPGLALPSRRSLLEIHRLVRALRSAYPVVTAQAPAETAALATAVGRYDRVLGRLGLTDAQVAARYPLSGVLGFTVRTLASLVFFAPLALAGTVLNFLPYLVVDRVADAGDRSLDHRATWKLFGAIFLYPLAWLLQAGLAGLVAGWPWAVALAVAAPLTAYPALRFHEHARRLQREARAYLLLRRRPRLASALRRRRGDIVAGLEALAAHSGISGFTT
ncbi:MAG: lysophospholipid acyltransferase family protein [Thermoanaerobaculia bacterium]|nr:lysophospholipid acyltransferase family protein [Thermoanaerobaculia bacterium]